MTIFESFKSSYSREGADYSILENAHGTERERLEDDLINDFLKTKDPWVALALGYITSSKATEILTSTLEKASSDQRPYLARALWYIEKDTKYLDIISYEVKNTELSDLERITIIWLFHKIKENKVFETLESALHDKEFLVRVNAAKLYSSLSYRKTNDKTIFNNIKHLDHEKIDMFIQKLRSKVNS